MADRDITFTNRGWAITQPAQTAKISETRGRPLLISSVAAFLLSVHWTAKHVP